MHATYGNHESNHEMQPQDAVVSVYASQHIFRAEDCDILANGRFRSTGALMCLKRIFTWLEGKPCTLFIDDLNRLETWKWNERAI